MKKIFLIVMIFLCSGNIFSQEQASVVQEVPEYRIKAEDTLEITVYGESDMTKTVKVSEEGKVIYPFVGEIKIQGLTLKEAAEEIENLLKKDYFVKPQVGIFVKEYSKFFIVGAVKEEGRYELKGNLTLLDAIALAGGADDGANLTKVKVIRRVNKKETECVVDFYNQGKTFLLEPLDRILVEEYGSVSVLGQVKKPGNYSFKKGITTVNAIARAGGFTEIASQNGVKVIRSSKDGKKETIIVPVGSILQTGDKSKDVLLKEGDIVSVPESFF